jgi:signal transduction histidine kinase
VAAILDDPGRGSGSNLVPGNDAQRHLLPYGRAMFAAVRVAGRYRDIVLAVAVAGLGYVELFAHSTYNGEPVWPGSELFNVFFIAFFTLPLVWRRRRPLPAYLMVMAVLPIGAAVLGGGQATAGFVAAIVAVFSGALYAERPALVALVAAASITVIDVSTPENRNLEAVAWGLAMLGVAWLLGRAVHGRQRTIGTLEQQAIEQGHRHEAAVAAATTAERASIARELHDIVAHAVSVIVIQSQAGSRALPDRPDIALDVLTTIEKSGRSALAELRRLLSLLSEQESSGLAPAPSLRNLDDLLRSSRSAGLRLEVSHEGLVPALEPAADLAAYRVLQEALTNTLRHAPGATAVLSIEGDAGGVRIVVQDDRNGRATGLDSGKGRGLIGMRERLALCGGELITAGQTGRGFRIEAWLPAATPELDTSTGHSLLANNRA